MDSQGAKSVMSNDMKELTEGKEQISSTIRGHKANLSNPSSCILAQSFKPRKHQKQSLIEDRYK